ncbi:hypothetical protein EIN_015460 [Entamoeba invadens IP1]|uniref:hypothetical protein n=1 Tax=Entamoeba invadens IP1 TaxID=370355 RepID=UPI0002C3F8E9|nr:hypothetical protein EIN_015460 [Entamoeba invadens IP1]ELP90387.1 hypothetical protein EIN_015460 [Entamoeba invadens IP1]|eukprot:XP_004257158.1 hypothetical protein EIN_015460 [Entamoeba invadens IP1]
MSRLRSTSMTSSLPTPTIFTGTPQKPKLTEVLHFEVTISDIIHLEEFEQRVVYLKWKRGSSKYSGQLKRVVVSKGIASFDSVIMFDLVIEREKSGQLKPKKYLKLDLIVITERGEKEKGCLDVDLTTYLDTKSSQEKLPFYKKSYLLHFKVDFYQQDLLISPMRSSTISESDSGSSKQSPRKRTPINVSLSTNSTPCKMREKESDAMKDKCEKLIAERDSIKSKLENAEIEIKQLETKIENMKGDSMNNPLETVNFIIDNIINTTYEFNGTYTLAALNIASRINEKNLFNDECGFFKVLSKTLSGVVKLASQQSDVLAFWIATLCALIHKTNLLNPKLETTEIKVKELRESFCGVLNEALFNFLQLCVGDVSVLIRYVQEKDNIHVECYNTFYVCVKQLLKYAVTQDVIDYVVQQYTDTIDRFLFTMIMRDSDKFNIQRGLSLKMKNDAYREWILSKFGKSSDSYFKRISELSMLMLLHAPDFTSFTNISSAIDRHILTEDNIIRALHKFDPPLTDLVLTKMSEETGIDVSTTPTFPKMFQPILFPETLSLAM